ncbi:MAG: HlyD family efflux transporter periplasmic adaptor subunit [Christensenellales bacterium]
MNLTIAVDELDVVEVAVGQKVKITVDALSDAEMDGEVYKIAPVGSNSGGVTTYDVELTFDAAGSGVRSGMNATGEITVASAEDTLYVPVEALMTIGDDTYLMVESSDGQTMSMSDASGMTPPDHADVSGMTPPDGARPMRRATRLKHRTAVKPLSGAGVATLQRSRPNKRAATCSPKPSRR